MNAKELLSELNTALGYNYEEHEIDAIMLTHTRYTKNTSLDAAYFASGDKTKVFKMTIEEIPAANLPDTERLAFEAEDDDDYEFDDEDDGDEDDEEE